MEVPFRLGDWLVEPHLDQLVHGDKKVRLEPKVIKLLVYLAENAGEVVPKEQIIRDVWDHALVTDEVLANGIWELRKALGDDAKNPRFIQTVPKKGYRLIAECHPVDTSEDSKKQIAWRLLTVAVSLSAVLAVAVWLLVSRESVNPLDSVAVLPFENLSGDPEQEYFADGMTDELIAQLAQIRKLKVIPRTSVLRYKGTEKSINEIAQELDVDAVVEGTFRRSEGRVRITIQLIEATTGRHLWAESFERDLRDVLALQSEMARSIAQQVQVTLTPEERARLAQSSPVSPEGREAYLKARYGTGLSWEKRLEYLQGSIAKDPDYAPAHVWLSVTYGTSETQP